MMEIQPLIIGSGNAGKAMAKALLCVNVLQSDFLVKNPIFAKRGETLPSLMAGHAHPLLLIASPHALHARTILQAEESGIRHMVVEKPACVSSEEAQALSHVRASVRVCHGYRVMWGPQKIRAAIASGEMGDLISIEGRYWQSSAAQRAGKASGSWKNDPVLNGPRDVLFDLGAHWVDLTQFFFAQKAERGRSWLAFANAEAPHRDTHAHLDLFFSQGRRATTSLSKAFHGATNDLEIHVVGSRQAASWYLVRPDEIIIGQAGNRTVVARNESELGSRQPPFHATGWLEGYIEIVHQALRDVAGLAVKPVPTLAEHLQVMRTLFTLEFD